ncbi:hypothetical protein SAMN05216338_107316 [Bradyrhizobium sp. Rc2d]|uniref:hypothetical protein n=1 Tax=Bradyrhizobium sp. Rc2d TaxID=1855321 RepID=UPI0008829AA0|nr:hypothetical protein [Bradyrhizobium sp. Rc2d]SDJ91619.1 hypothetical protein SAMN05216338_107316 [Bradyrhizobium sp. Rc2d]
MSERIHIDRLHLRRMRFKDLDHAVVKAYQQALRGGAKFPPIEIVNIRGKLWIHEGYHRYYAHKREGRKTILARNIIVYE